MLTIIQVDRVPLSSLERLTKISDTLLFDTSNEFVTNYDIKVSELNTWGNFNGMERVTFGSKSDIYYKLRGISCTNEVKEVVGSGKISDVTVNGSGEAVAEWNCYLKKNEDERESERYIAGDKVGGERIEKERKRNGERVDKVSSIIPQLVLQCSSKLTSGISVRLLKRCLLATIKAVEDSHSSSFVNPKPTSTCDSNSSPSSNLNPNPYSLFPSSSSLPPFSSSSSSFPSTTSTSSSPPCSPNPTPSSSSSKPLKWVPGGGAAEMGWSALWSMIADQLDSYLKLQLSNSSSCPINLGANSRFNTNASGSNNHSTDNSNSNSNNNNTDNSKSNPDINKSKPVYISSSNINKSNAANKTPGDRSFHEILLPLVETLSETILQTINQKHPHPNPNPAASIDNINKNNSKAVSLSGSLTYSANCAALHYTIEICHLLAIGYAEVPRQLLLNASTKGNKISKKTEDIWKVWKEHYLGKKNVIECSFDLKCTPGRLGLVSVITPLHHLPVRLVKILRY
jgi:hypothetical protein